MSNNEPEPLKYNLLVNPVVRFGVHRHTQHNVEQKVSAALDPDNPPPALRIVPLLGVSGSSGDRKTLVGTVCIVVSGAQDVAIELYISALYVESVAPNSPGWSDVTSDAAHHREVLGVCTDLFTHFKPDRLEADQVRTSANQHVAAQFAKMVCEESRNSLRELREMRYQLEHDLAVTSAEATSSARHTAVVSSLLQLDVMCGRTGDQAREAVREGLWLHVTDLEAYHAYRLLQDPSIVSPYQPATRDLRSWMQLHDAALRQCTEMRKQLDAESVSIRSLIASASSISGAKDADAQSRFNVLAAIASVGLGLPALVLTLYGATILLPLNSTPRLLAFTPVAVSLGIAASIAMWQGHRLERGRVWTFSALGILLVLLLLLLIAGFIAPV